MSQTSMPASPSASATPSLAQHTPSAPALIWRRAMSADLWVLECSRLVSLWALAKDAISAMLRSSVSRSSAGAGAFSEQHTCLLADEMAVKTLGFAPFLVISGLKVAHHHGLAGRLTIEASSFS